MDKIKLPLLKEYTDEMNDQIADAILDVRLKKIRETLGVKAKEYMRNGDRLYNFNRGALITQQSREAYLLKGLAMKQIVSCIDIVDDLENNKLASDAMIEEKIGDVINYMILLEMCLKQRNFVKEKTLFDEQK